MFLIAETHIVFVRSASANPGSSPCLKPTHVLLDAQHKTHAIIIIQNELNNKIVFFHVEIISRYMGEFSRSYMINITV